MKHALGSDFVQGIACAAAFIARERDEPGMAADMIREFGYTYKDLKAAGTDEYDLAALREEMEGGAWAQNCGRAPDLTACR